MSVLTVFPFQRTIPVVLALVVSLISGPSLCQVPDESLEAAAEAAEAGRGKFHYKYVVQDGDTLYLVARKFGVSMKSIKRRNRRYVRKGRLRVGKTLKIYSKVPIRPRRTAYYVIKRGDSLYRIAKKLDVHRGELRKLNRIRGDVIHPGDKLVYLTEAPEKVSESVGSCAGGKLVSGEKLPEGPGYTFGHRRHIYGTNETITLLLDSIARYRKKYPTGPIVVVGNLSQKGGGKLDPHKSHQSGRDVDLGYIHKKKFQPITHMIATNKKNIDLRKTWYLMESLLKTGRVEKMFIDYKIQKLLYEHLKGRNYVARYLKKILQYPRGKHADAIIEHEPGHHHHIHLRFKCPEKDKRCR